jgi:hypothetical protein
MRRIRNEDAGVNANDVRPQNCFFWVSDMREMVCWKTLPRGVYDLQCMVPSTTSTVVLR